MLQTVIASVGALTMLALAPQPGAAYTASLDEHSGGAAAVHQSTPAPSAACVAAKNAIIAAFKADAAEDRTERNLEKTGAATNDAAEDRAEIANFKALWTSLRSACALHKPAARPTASAQCTAAKAALSSFMTQLRAQEKADWANHTEWSAADRAEDAANWAQMRTLFHNVAAACGFQRR